LCRHSAAVQPSGSSVPPKPQRSNATPDVPPMCQRLAKASACCANLGVVAHVQRTRCRSRQSSVHRPTGPRSRCSTDEVLGSPPAKSKLAPYCTTQDHWCIERPCGLLRITRSRMARKEVVGVVGDPCGPLGGLQVFRLVERLSQLDRALFVVSPAYDRVSLT
jgi:hypothetical protein